MLIGGSMYNLKKIFGSLGKVITGSRLGKPKDFTDLLCLLFLLLTKTMKSKGPDRAGSPYRKAVRKLYLQAPSQDHRRTISRSTSSATRCA